MKKTKEFYKYIKALLGQLFWKDRMATLFLYLTLLLNIIAGSLMYWTLKSQQTILVLHYNAYFGIDLFINFETGDEAIDFFIAPLTALGIWLLNFIIGSVLYFQGSQVKKDGEKLRLKPNKNSPHYIGSMMIFGTSLLIQLALLVYVVAIVLVNR